MRTQQACMPTARAAAGATRLVTTHARAHPGLAGEIKVSFSPPPRAPATQEPLTTCHRAPVKAPFIFVRLDFGPPQRYARQRLLVGVDAAQACRVRRGAWLGCMHAASARACGLVRPQYCRNTLVHCVCPAQVRFLDAYTYVMQTPTITVPDGACEWHGKSCLQLHLWRQGTSRQPSRDATHKTLTPCLGLARLCAGALKHATHHACAIKL